MTKSMTLVFRNFWKIIVVFLLLAYTLVTLGPFLLTFVWSFRTTVDIMDNPYGISWPPYLENYLYAITPSTKGSFGPEGKHGFGIFKYVKNSAIVTAGALFFSTVLTTMAAYGFGRRRYAFRFREVIFLIIFISIMFPPQITLLSLYQVLVKYKLRDTLQGLMLVYTVSAMPFNIYILRAFFAQIPQDMEDAARIDGCNDWQMFLRVMVPLAKPALATIIIFNFMSFWNEFLYAVTFISKEAVRTLPLAIMFFQGEAWIDIGMLASGLMVSVLPIIVLYLILSEQFIRGMMAGALKG